MFVREGITEPSPIGSMPGIVQHSLDSLRRAVAEAAEERIGGVMLFGVPETRDAVGSGSGRAATSVSHSVAPTREDGNNVNLDAETLSSTDTQLRYQLLTQAASGKLTMISAALRTS